jgi:hypothetical protein
VTLTRARALLVRYQLERLADERSTG